MTDRTYRPLGVPGIPRPGPQQKPEPPPTAEIPPRSPGATRPGATRPGDNGLGVPRQVAREGRELTDAERGLLEQLRGQAERNAAEELLAALSERGAGFRIPRFIGRGATLAVLGLGALVVLFAVAQVGSIVATLSQFGPVGQGIVLGIVALCLLLLGYVGARLFGLLFRLRANRQVQSAALKQLAERHRWQAMALAREHLDRARKDLTRYLDAYPLEKKDEPALRRAGLSEAQIADLRRARDGLLNPNFQPGDDAWIGAFTERFQGVLDAAAERRRQDYAWRVGLASAASPNAAIDGTIVLYWGLKLVGDLARLYNVRSDAGSTALILARAVGYAYLGGHLQQVSEPVAGNLVDELQVQLGRVGAQLVGGTARRVAEGAVNTLLVRRLGKATMRLLQPVAPGR